MALWVLTASSMLPTKWLFVSLQTTEEAGAQRGDITGPRSERDLGLEAVGGLSSLLCATSWACPRYRTLSTSLGCSEPQGPHLHSGFDGSSPVRFIELRVIIIIGSCYWIQWRLNELIQVKCLEEFLSLKLCEDRNVVST